MSYSFQTRSANKEAAKAAVAAEFAKVVSQQLHHAQDHYAALVTADSLIDLVGEDDTKDIVVNCNGSVGWNFTTSEDPANVPLTNASITCSVYFVARETAQ